MTTEIRDADVTTRPDPERRGVRGRIPPELTTALLYCLKVFLLVRLGLALLAVVGVALVPPNEPAGVPGWPAPDLTPGWHNLFTSWERWDGLWFLRIASAGYAVGDGSAAFFPLYPLIVRGFSFALGGHPLGAALIVSNVSCLAAMVTVYRLTEFEFDARRARNTIVLMSLFPTVVLLPGPVYGVPVPSLSGGIDLCGAARTLDPRRPSGCAGVTHAERRASPDPGAGRGGDPPLEGARRPGTHPARCSSGVRGRRGRRDPLLSRVLERLRR